MERNRDHDEEELQEAHSEKEGTDMPRTWRPSREAIAAMQQPSDVPQKPQDYKVVGDASDKAKLSTALEKLEASDSGKPIGQAMKEHETTVQFGPLPMDTVAQWEGTTDGKTMSQISISDTQRNASPEVLAAHLAHEGTHAQWHKDGSINQEYHAFKNQSAVWDSVRGSQTDLQCDEVSRMIAKGDADAKADIRRMYADQKLPEY